MDRRASALLAGLAAFVVVMCGFTIALPLLGASAQDACLPTPTANPTISAIASTGPSPTRTNTPQASTTGPTPRNACDSVLARARTWLTAWNGGPVPYLVSNDPADLLGGYRRDCSGYVSMALGLPGPGLDTSDLAVRSHPLLKGDLRPGDLLINPAPGGAGHVVIFERWTDATMTSYMGYEQAGDTGTIHRQIPYPYFHGYQMTPYAWPPAHSLQHPHLAQPHPLHNLGEKIR
jgi:hypothetical protein